jgi:hypothetical protein
LHAVHAETGRPSQSGASLLNAGFGAIQAQTLPEPAGGWSLPQHAVALFIEAETREELNRPVSVALTLAEVGGKKAYFMPGPNADPDCSELLLTHEVVIPPIVADHPGQFGTAVAVIDLGAATVWIEHADSLYEWVVTVGDVQDRIRFWVASNLRLSARPVPLSSLSTATTP